MVSRIRCSRFLWSKVNFLRTAYPQPKYRDKTNPNKPTWHAFKPRPSDKGHLSVDLCNRLTRIKNLSKKDPEGNNYLVALTNTTKFSIDPELQSLLPVLIYWEPVIFIKVSGKTNIFHFTIKIDEDNFLISRLLAKHSDYLK